MLKILKSDADYEGALAELDSLMDSDPEPGTKESDKLEVLSLLIEDFERRNYEFELPDPVEAIKFRMEQQGLTQRHLIPYIGGRSKVSEILSGKRPLTLSMIRALHSGLGIPADVLLQERDPQELIELNVEWDRFPLMEASKRGWIQSTIYNVKDRAEDIWREFFNAVPDVDLLGLRCPKPALRRQSIRSGRSMDEYALKAWTGRILIRGLGDQALPEYQPGSIDMEFLRYVVRLSWSKEGPVSAWNYLWRAGIPLVIEPHLPGTYLDGSAIMTPSGRPVVGMTLRYDRIDNFWFTLVHELAHVSLHFNDTLDTDVEQFLDDFDVEDEKDIELEADEMAKEALIPKDEWSASGTRLMLTRSSEAVERFARRLNIHPAIVAGRIRYELKSYRLLNQLVGHGQVRRHFGDIDYWET